MKTIYVAGGCFWGLEKYIGLVDGVVATEVGYANGASASATYGDGSGYAEAVKVVYDPAVAPLPFLLDLFYDAIEPTSVNRQGNDVGVEYRTGIYYTDPADAAVIEKSLARLQTKYSEPIAVESGPLTTYTRAEDYHQDYLEKNPGGYCHIPQKLFDAAAAARPRRPEWRRRATQRSLHGVDEGVLRHSRPEHERVELALEVAAAQVVDVCLNFS